MRVGRITTSIDRQRDYSFSFLPICTGFGIAFGALIHNIGAGMAIGVGMGTILSLVTYYYGP